MGCDVPNIGSNITMKQELMSAKEAIAAIFVTTGYMIVVFGSLAFGK